MIQPFWLPHQRVISRKERLYCCACVRRVWYRLRDQESGRRAVEVAEEFADMQRTWRDLAEARDSALAACEALSGSLSKEEQQVLNALRAAAECAVEENSGQFGIGETTGWLAVGASRESEEAERATQRARYEDLFGTPDQLMTFDLAWRTELSVSLAQQMYESRDFSEMPILADALQDAGCTNGDMLAHCRGPGPRHVRGCWVVDLVLGKE
jgi:hypothetical protein